jgi:hypothetical protein
MEEVLFAGRIVHLVLQIQVLTVSNQNLTAEEQVKHFGNIKNATTITHRVVRNGELCGILNAKKTSTMLHAVSVLQIVHQASQTSEYHARNPVMVTQLANH